MKYQCGEVTIEQHDPVRARLQSRAALTGREPAWTATLGDLSVTAATQRGVHMAMVNELEDLRPRLVEGVR